MVFKIKAKNRYFQTIDYFDCGDFLDTRRRERAKSKQRTTEEKKGATTQHRKLLLYKFSGCLLLSKRQNIKISTSN